jgi:hypothetical protein
MTPLLLLPLLSQVHDPTGLLSSQAGLPDLKPNPPLLLLLQVHRPRSLLPTGLPGPQPPQARLHLLAVTLPPLLLPLLLLLLFQQAQ